MQGGGDVVVADNRGRAGRGIDGGLVAGAGACAHTSQGVLRQGMRLPAAGEGAGEKELTPITVHVGAVSGV